MALPAGLQRVSLGKQWLNVSGGGGHAKQASPDAQMGQRIVDFRLRQEALGLRDFVDVPEA